MAESLFTKGYQAVDEHDKYVAEHSVYELYLKYGDPPVRVRFLDNEPLCFCIHMLKQGNFYKKIVCTKGSGDAPCVPCDEKGMTKQFVGAYRVWDYANNRVKIWIRGKTDIQMLRQLSEQDAKLTGCDIMIMRAGKGTNTTYNYVPQAATEFKSHEGEPIEVVQKQVNLEEKYAPLTLEEQRKLFDNPNASEQFNHGDNVKDDNVDGNGGKGYSF